MRFGWIKCCRIGFGGGYVINCFYPAAVGYAVKDFPAFFRVDKNKRDTVFVIGFGGKLLYSPTVGKRNIASAFSTSETAGGTRFARRKSGNECPNIRVGFSGRTDCFTAFGGYRQSIVFPIFRLVAEVNGNRLFPASEKRKVMFPHFRRRNTVTDYVLTNQVIVFPTEKRAQPGYLTRCS